jgi:hypothetical protein
LSWAAACGTVGCLAEKLPGQGWVFEIYHKFEFPTKTVYYKCHNKLHITELASRILETTVCVTKEKVYHQLSCQTINFSAVFCSFFVYKK